MTDEPTAAETCTPGVRPERFSGSLLLWLDIELADWAGDYSGVESDDESVSPETRAAAIIRLDELNKVRGLIGMALKAERARGGA